MMSGVNISHRAAESQREECGEETLSLHASVGGNVCGGGVSHGVSEAQRNLITGDILDASVKIHKMFGPGLLESVYERLLAVELTKRGHKVVRQKNISFEYEGEVFENAFCVDMIVDDDIVVELKSTGTMSPVYPKQLRTYLVILGKELGVLVNFGMATIKEGFKRVVNDVNLSTN